MAVDLTGAQTTTIDEERKRVWKRYQRLVDYWPIFAHFKPEDFMNEQSWYKFSYERATKEGTLSKNQMVFAGQSQEEALGKATDALKRQNAGAFRIVDVKVWHPYQTDFIGGGAPPKSKS